MGMPDAATVIGAGVSLFGLGVAVHLCVDAWLRVRRFERETATQDAGRRSDTAFADRMDRIEQIVESTAIEVERIAEGQRFVTLAIADQRRSNPQHRSAERVITPH